MLGKVGKRERGEGSLILKILETLFAMAFKL